MFIFANRVTDDRKGILADLTIGRDVVRRFNVALVDLDFRHKLINVDGASAFDLNGVKFLVLNSEVLAFGNFIAARCVLPGNHLARFGIHILLLQSVAGLSIEPIEADFFTK